MGDSEAAHVGGGGRRGGETAGERVAIEEAGADIGQCGVGGTIVPRLRIRGNGKGRRRDGQVGAPVGDRVVRIGKAPLRDAKVADARNRGRRGGQAAGERVAIEEAGTDIDKGRVGGAVET